MPLLHFCRKREDVPEDAVDPILSTDWRDSVVTDVPRDVPPGEHPGDLWLYKSHVGLCLQDREMNGYHDSDFYMKVWAPTLGVCYEVCYASTRGWCYPCFGSSVDATPEVRALAEQWEREQAAERHRLAEIERAKLPAKGKTLRVVRGRKVPQGTEGRCFWISEGRSRYGGYHEIYRVGIETASGERHFTAASNVEVVQ